jgi:hypothetical protein
MFVAAVPPDSSAVVVGTVMDPPKVAAAVDAESVKMVGVDGYERTRNLSSGEK